MAHGQRVQADKGTAIILQQVALDRLSPHGVGPVQHHHLLAVTGRLLQAVGQGIKEGINPGPYIDNIHEQHIKMLIHGGGGPTHLAVETEHRQTADRIEHMGRLDHIVLFFRKKTVLGGEQAGELARKGGHDEIPAVAEVAIGGGLIAEQGQPLAGKIGRRGS